VGLAFPDADDGDDEEDVGGEGEECAAEAAARDVADEAEYERDGQDGELEGESLRGVEAHARLRARDDEQFDDGGGDADVEGHVGQYERELFGDAEPGDRARRGLRGTRDGGRAAGLRGGLAETRQGRLLVNRLLVCRLLIGGLLISRGRRCRRRSGRHEDRRVGLRQRIVDAARGRFGVGVQARLLVRRTRRVARVAAAAQLFGLADEIRIERVCVVLASLLRHGNYYEAGAPQVRPQFNSRPPRILPFPNAFRS